MVDLFLDFEQPAPKDFFDEVVYSESKKMLFRVGDADRISPFLGLEHGALRSVAKPQAQDVSHCHGPIYSSATSSARGEGTLQ